MWDVKHFPTFRRNAVPPSSGSAGPRIAVRKKYVHCTRAFLTAVPLGSQGSEGEGTIFLRNVGKSSCKQRHIPEDLNLPPKVAFHLPEELGRVWQFCLLLFVVIVIKFLVTSAKVKHYPVLAGHRHVFVLWLGPLWKLDFKNNG